ncbi:sigma-54-dependent transcriptional regulator [Paraferrimonas sedimenticola]|uniref:Sigma-54-dependent Fis family transcriptional regulator n=1 Tax=Paraferrimonas sedimenticola TaxID=375674 RepID=A0AA37W2D9_9GAMM|nr:sigma-54 dependent transcriptional regulator [Paraferrimonas sedimenticola]GLP97945.1 sigma-54-dependent Fis family transcriptional regulator [Paraferrimonas sedimenticola]
MDTILIVDDNQAICQALSLMLEINGYNTVSCYSPAQAIEVVKNQPIALVLQDMNFTGDTTSGEEGRELFFALREIEPDLPIILMTAWTQLELAVELVRSGAADYIGKPWDDAKLLTSVNNLTSLQKLNRENQQLSRVDAQRTEHIKAANLCGMVFASGAMQRCVDLALQIAKSEVPVLISGPNGAGKDKIADILHANSSLKDKPLIKVNIGALPIDLLEAELFGAEAGAFTGANKTRIGRFEAADGGTLFLDEIGNLPLSGQVKLLRVLQTGEFERLGSHQTRKVKVRVISATNANLVEDIQSGVFREDLYYRLNVIELAVPPLSQRVDDIIPLVNHFIGSDYRLNKTTVQALEQHNWPGNVRELENACKRATILASSPQLSPVDFGLSANIDPSQQSSAREGQAQQSSAREGQALQKLVQPKAEPAELDKASIEALLQQHNGVIARAAKAVGLTRQSLYRRMEKLGIPK